MYSSTLSITSALDGGGQRHAPATLPQEGAGTHRIGAWVAPRAGLDGCGKSRPPPAFEPGTFQPVASRYTDYEHYRIKQFILLKVQKLLLDLEVQVAFRSLLNCRQYRQRCLTDSVMFTSDRKNTRRKI